MNETIGTHKLRKWILKPWVWVSMALFCCVLWGSVFAAIKSGYELFQVEITNPFSIMVFAGSRFTLGGILILCFSLLFTRKLPLPPAGEWPNVIFYALVQTTFHHSLFYIALANSAGVKSAILNGSSPFFLVILSHFFFKDEQLTNKKILALIFGFIGIVILNLKGEGIDTNFTFMGEGMMLLASLFGALGNIMTKRLGARTKPIALSAWQLFLGGSIMSITGLMFGGKMYDPLPGAWLLLLYLGAVSAAAFSTWALLLRFHPISNIGIFQASTPFIGSISAWLILGEAFWNLQNIVAIICITTSIVLINRAVIDT